jgi:hypothetical protein
MEAPQNRRFYGKMECLTLWPTTYIGEKGNKVGKTSGTYREPLENLMGTCWE